MDFFLFLLKYMLMIGGVVIGLAKVDTVSRPVALACFSRLVDSMLHPSKLVFAFELIFFFFLYIIFNKSVILFFLVS